jgi:predicted Holliday junction resolvase-like endonuclease
MILTDYLILIFTIVIIIQFIIMYLMFVRIRQLQQECETMESRMRLTDTELEELTKNVEEIKKIQI